jgi:DNA topoisomerase-2
VRRISESLSKKYTNATRLTQIIKDNLSLVIEAEIINPTFTSQTKEVLATPSSKLGFDYTVSPALYKKLCNSSLSTVIEQSIEKKDDKGATKAIRNKTGNITDYEKATKLGGNKDCTLWITEGKSAKALVVSGFSVIGREQNGVYPLRGKPLNVHDKTLKDTLQNKEWLDMIHILNLDPTKTYDKSTIAKLPYKHLAIVTDQDDDGSHILGLVLVFFKKFFRSLIDNQPSFLLRFVTPIVKAKETTKSPYIHFFSLQAFRQWAEDHRCSEANYYKGLGTSSASEAKEYFKASQKHTVRILFEDENCYQILSESYGDSFSNKRKEMIQTIDFNSFVDYTKPNVTVTDFCQHELVHFSYANITRTIPGIDGLKPGQRKTLYTVFHDKAPTKYKVAELAAKVTGFAAYHHGEASLQETIAHMTQQYCGANQIRYLQALSQSGTRHDDRKVHAQPRYMNTKIADLARYIFIPSEDAVLEYNEEDGKRVEPKCYSSTIPMSLINGTKGIGTGYATEIPTFGVMEVLERCKLACEGGKHEFPLEPKSNGFMGTIQKDGNSCVYEGIVLNEGETWKEGSHKGQVLRITELPPQMWTNNVKESIAKHDWVKEVVTYTKDDNVDLRIHIYEQEDLEKRISDIKKMITKKVSMNNMYLFNSSGKLTHYTTPEEIIEEHSNFKLEICNKRLEYLISQTQQEMRLALAKYNYIQYIQNGDIKILNVSKIQLKEQIQGCEELVEFITQLLQMVITSLTIEESTKLHETYKRLEDELEELGKKTANMLWMEDLLALESQLFPNKRDGGECSSEGKKAKMQGNEFNKPSGFA